MLFLVWDSVKNLMTRDRESREDVQNKESTWSPKTRELVVLNASERCHDANFNHLRRDAVFSGSQLLEASSKFQGIWNN